MLFLVLIAGSCSTTKEPCISCPSQTLDTTSHNFSWKFFTLGEGNSSSLQDVTIISDSLAYAVGEIYLKDSTGAFDPLPYNSAIWNGQDWVPKRISVLLSGNQIVPPLEGVIAFSENDIWCVGSFPIHGDGNTWTLFHLQNMGISASVSKVWGTSSSNMYFVGRSGSIVHFDGNNWQKIESGTDLRFSDVYGSIDPQTLQTQIFSVCTSNFPLNRGIFRIDGNKATEVSSSPIQWELNSVWFESNKQYYVAGDGIYQKNDISDGSWKNEPLDITHYATTKIRGQSSNDLFAVGSFGDCIHWNGATWLSFQAQTGLSNGSYTSLSFKRDKVVVVGADQSLARIALGQRQN